MNKFDFIQFSVPFECVIEPDDRLLTKVTELNGKMRYLLSEEGRRLISKHDFRMEFKINEEKALIGISSKILGVDYPELIHKDNIADCLSTMSSYGLFKEIDFDQALKEGRCNKLEVTRDINLEFTKTEYEDISRMVFDLKKWNPQVLKNSFGVFKSDDSEAIKFYGKNHEMSLKRNSEYVNAFDLVGKFEGMTRVESKLLTAKAIRKRFGDNTLSTVLTTTVNPLADLVDEIFVNQDNQDEDKKLKGNFLKKHRDRQRLSYAMEFGFDFGRIANDMRSRDPHNWTREFEDIRKVAEGEDSTIRQTRDKINSIKKMLIFK